MEVSFSHMAKPATPEYGSNYDRIFGKKKPKKECKSQESPEQSDQCASS